MQAFVSEQLRESRLDGWLNLDANKPLLWPITLHIVRTYRVRNIHNHKIPITPRTDLDVRQQQGTNVICKCTGQTFFDVQWVLTPTTSLVLSRTLTNSDRYVRRVRSAEGNLKELKVRSRKLSKGHEDLVSISDRTVSEC